MAAATNDQRVGVSMLADGDREMRRPTGECRYVIRGVVLQSFVGRAACRCRLYCCGSHRARTASPACRRARRSRPFSRRNRRQRRRWPRCPSAYASQQILEDARLETGGDDMRDFAAIPALARIATRPDARDSRCSPTICFPALITRRRSRSCTAATGTRSPNGGRRSKIASRCWTSISTIDSHSGLAASSRCTRQ